MIRSLLIALSLVAASPAAAQSHEARSARTYTQADLWNRSGERITFSLGGISLPTRAGETRMTRSVEASQQGRGLDNALLYFSSDEAVFATVYIYAPALPDAALTGFMTDYAIHLHRVPTSEPSEADWWPPAAAKASRSAPIMPASGRTGWRAARPSFGSAAGS
jgi:hypothetical protein